MRCVGDGCLVIKPLTFVTVVFTAVACTRRLANGLITSAIKLAIKLTIKLKINSFCSYNKRHFVVATTKMLMRAATVVQGPGRCRRSRRSLHQGRRATCTTGGTGQLAAHNCCSPHFCCSYNKMLLVVAAITLKF